MSIYQTLWLQLVFLLFWASNGEAQYMKYKDPELPISVRIKDLMTRMTLAEKIGQMTQIEREVASAQVMQDYFIGKDICIIIIIGIFLLDDELLQVVC